MIIIKILVILSFIGMIYVNYLANAKPLGGNDTGEISARYNTLFTPSGFTFSIWGVIYLLLLVFIVNYTLLDKATFIDSNMTVIGILFIVSCAFNASWLFAWHFDKIALSTVIMIGFLVVLFSILQTTTNSGITYLAFSVYTGWVSVALIANISITLFKYDIKLFMNNEWFWFYTIIVISIGIGLWMALIEMNYWYAAVFLWAYFGIAMKYAKK